MYTGLQQPLQPSSSLLGSNNGLSNTSTNLNFSRRHSRSRSNGSLNSSSTASTSLLTSAPGLTPLSGKRPFGATTSSVPETERPSTAPYKPELQQNRDEVAIEDKQATSSTASPGSKRRSSVAEGFIDRWSQSTGSPRTNGEDRETKRGGSWTRRLSFVGNGGGSVNGSSVIRSPPSGSANRRGSSNVRRKSPDSSPTQRRSFHSPPPPPGIARSTATLPPLSTLPSLPKLTFEPLSSSTGTPSPPTVLSSPITQASSTQDYFTPKSPKRSPKKKKAGDTSIKTRVGFQDSSDDLRSSRKENLDPDTSKYSTNPSPAITPGSSTYYSSTSRQRSVSRNSNRERSASDSSIRDPPGGSGTSPRRRDPKEKDKKAMLSRALQKANTAVLLDNAQNFEGAVEAYVEACNLLREVMRKSSGEDDKRKLEAIRETYMSRIKELRELDPSLGQATPGKSLPARPASEVDPNPQLSNEPPTSDDDEPIEIQTATVTRIANDKSVYNSTTSPPSNANNRPLETTRPTITRDSTLASAFKAVESALPIDNQTSFLLQSPITPGDNGSAKERIISMELPMMPMDKTYMPPPLSPRYPPSPKTASAEQPSSHLLQPPKQQQPQKHSREGSSGSVSWLDTIDESNSSSCRSSMHSTSSEGPMRRQAVKARPESNGTQAEFDAALDAAVEAAYDEGLEPDEEDRLVIHSGDAVRTALRNVELAKERVREAEREEAIQAAKLKDKERRLREGTKGSNGKLDLTFGRDELGRVREGSKRANGKLDLPLVRDDLGRGMGFGQTSPYGDDDDAEEERLLDEMTREYMLDGFDFGLQNKSALPRQSDGSEFSGSGSTWNSSRSSNRTTGTNAATAISALGTVAESEGFERPGLATSKSMGALPTVSETNGIKKTATPPPKPATSSSRPSTANGPPLKPPPAAPSASTLPRQQSQQSSVRSRRMSGQNAKQLKIETSLPSKSSLMNKKQPEPPLSSNSRTPPSVPPKSPPMATSMAGGIYQSSNISARPQLQKTKSLVEPFVPLPAHSPADTTITVSPATPGLTKVISNDGSLPPPSPGRVSSKPQRLELRKNKSSISLRNNRQLSVSSPDVSDGGSVGTPMSTTFSNFSAKTKGSTLVNSSTASQMTAVPGMPAGALPFAIEAGTPSGGMHLFESDIHSPSQPGSPNPLAFQPPAPLEPCPCSHLLRPFWLMRCLYQTMAHPRGGYLSTKLFVPREVWKVKGIKLKAVDEKIANCDLLTAALGKLARVDMIDADAVLEEMQSLEVVLDQVQTALSKKLGNDVGVSGLSSLFSQGPTQNGEGGAGANDTTGLRTSGGDKSKGYLASWRRLRSKNSAAGLTSLTTTGLSAKKDGPPSGSEEGKNAPTMATIPMTSLPNIRFAKRDVDKIDWNAVGGALSNYMSSLARLCDAVQVVDQIARQVEDPGLKLSSPTHVGLELCTRHASEFFGFYVCRFVLTDVGIMLDKFLKRSSEWVLV